jgi:hemerythrin-like domain-containing protein
MKPIGPLMREHRLIERMVGLVKEETAWAREEERPPSGIMEAVDFFRTYADRTHHGKEEDILFRDLASRDLSPEHRQIMDELVAEHVVARRTVGSLAEGHRRLGAGDSGGLRQMVDAMQTLVDLYPKHIDKEDQRFFYPCMEYFTRQEQDAMLEEFWKFDQRMIHEKYARLVEELSRNLSLLRKQESSGGQGSPSPQGA